MADEFPTRKAPAYMRRQRLQRRARLILGLMAAGALAYRMWSSYAG